VRIAGVLAKRDRLTQDNLSSPTANVDGPPPGLTRFYSEITHQ
jgi:hypothetical protein